MKRQSRHQKAGHAASLRLQAPDQIDLVWKQWGKALVEQYPRAEWPTRIAQIPEIYRPLIASRLLRNFGDKVEYEK